MSPERGIEAEKGEVVFWKRLRLMPEQETERFGIASEGPVFVSPDISLRRTCLHCQQEYSPIIYGHDLVTPQHFHEPGNGGIYHHTALPSSFKQQEKKFINCWVAILDPIELDTKLITETMSPLVPFTSSKGVYVREIRAYTRGEIKEGYLVEYPDPYQRSHSLYPSGYSGHSFGPSELGFKIIDGEVLFTKIPPTKP